VLRGLSIPSDGRDSISQFAKANKPASCFIPKHEAHARKTLTKGKATNIGKIGVMAKRDWQPIKRNSAAEMVDVMQADIGSEPAQDHRKIVV
jgi:hypothetical protein